MGGWGTALKPATEIICLARKPLGEKTVVANVLKHGTGALNIDASRVPLGESDSSLIAGVKHEDRNLDTADNEGKWGFKAVDREAGLPRWPANLIHDGSDEVLELFPNTNGQCGKDLTEGDKASSVALGDKAPVSYTPEPRGDKGSAARFFYCAKAGKNDRAGSKHPTVKPLALIRYLIRMITPPGGTVLDPFAGSGTTGASALMEGHSVTLCEMDDDYTVDIENRMNQVKGWV